MRHHAAGAEADRNIIGQKPDRHPSWAGQISQAVAAPTGGRALDSCPGAEASGPCGAKTGGRAPGLRPHTTPSHSAPPCPIQVRSEIAAGVAPRRIIAAVEKTLAGRPAVAVNVRLVSDAGISLLHAQYLDDPSPTDVLTFDLREQPGGPV